MDESIVSDLRSALGGPSPLVLDGGLGSMLIARGLGRGEPPERWNLERPQEVTAVHRAYVEAGSDAVHANTFGANRVRLGAFGLGARCAELNRLGIELARQAGPRFVLGDVGPTGEYLPPVGKADPERWREAFLEQGQALAAAGADGLHVETMSDLREALVALSALREAAPGLPVWISLTYDRKKRGFFTVMGNALAPAIAELVSHGADGVGANCSITSPDMRELVVEAMRALGAAPRAVPLIAQPNAGQPRMAAEGVAYDQSPEDFATDAAAMAAAGASAVGGCCGTDPRFIAALRRQLRATSAQQE